MSAEATAHTTRYDWRGGVTQALVGAVAWLVIVSLLRALGVTERGSLADLSAGMAVFIFFAALTASRQGAARRAWPRAILEALVLALGAGAVYYFVVSR